MRRCQMCGITEKGTRSKSARVSPTGIVHLTYLAGTRTYCGKRTTSAWRTTRG